MRKLANPPSVVVIPQNIYKHNRIHNLNESQGKK